MGHNYKYNYPAIWKLRENILTMIIEESKDVYFCDQSVIQERLEVKGIRCTEANISKAISEMCYPHKYKKYGSYILTKKDGLYVAEDCKSIELKFTAKKNLSILLDKDSICKVSDAMYMFKLNTSSAAKRTKITQTPLKCFQENIYKLIDMDTVFRITLDGEYITLYLNTIQKDEKFKQAIKRLENIFSEDKLE